MCVCVIIIMCVYIYIYIYMHYIEGLFAKLSMATMAFYLLYAGLKSIRLRFRV